METEDVLIKINLDLEEKNVNRDVILMLRIT
jgi:hypothetical protein